MSERANPSPAAMGKHRRTHMREVAAGPQQATKDLDEVAASSL